MSLAGSSQEHFLRNGLRPMQHDSLRSKMEKEIYISKAERGSVVEREMLHANISIEENQRSSSNMSMIRRESREELQNNSASQLSFKTPLLSMLAKNNYSTIEQSSSRNTNYYQSKALTQLPPLSRLPRTLINNPSASPPP